MRQRKIQQIICTTSATRKLLISHRAEGKCHITLKLPEHTATVKYCAKN